jgi:hypothetical protein
MSSNITQKAVNFFFENIANKAVELAVDKAVAFVVNNPNHLIEGILEVAVLSVFWQSFMDGH